MAEPAVADPILTARGLRKEYGERVAVDDLDLSVAEGGSLAIVGESGSGKTTVARMIVGLTRPTAGTILACGRDRSLPARSAAERRRRGAEIQIVFQDPYSSLNPRHGALHVLDKVLRLHDRDRDAGQRRARVAELAELVLLDDQRGCVVERGPTLQVLDDPPDPYTQLLRASVPRPGWKPTRRRRAAGAAVTEGGT